MNRDYWVVIFTGTTWQEFERAGSNAVGFRDSRWKYVKNIKPKDYLLCYLSGVSRFIAVLEVQSEPYHDSKRIWREDIYPARVGVKPVVSLTPASAIPVTSLKGLSIFENLRTPSGWSVRFRGSPQRWDEEDAKIIIQAIKDAKRKPVERAFDERLFKRGRWGSAPSKLHAK